MNRWPSWRFERALDEAEQTENLQHIAEAKVEAEQALADSVGQLEQVRRMTREHEPIRRGMKNLRMQNHFAEGLRRVIEEGR